jgi:hypothetical protein
MIKLTEQQVQEICEAFAKREGWIRSKLESWYYRGDDEAKPIWCDYFDYPNDKNAMGRIIEGMTYSTELYRYHSYLTAMFEASVGEYAYVKMHKATAQQQFVAAAMALGLLKEVEK